MTSLIPFRVFLESLTLTLVSSYLCLCSPHLICHILFKCHLYTINIYVCLLLQSKPSIRAGVRSPPAYRTFICMSLSPSPHLNMFCPHRDKLWESVGSASHLELTPNPPRFLFRFSSEPVQSPTSSHYPLLITLALHALLEAVLAFWSPSCFFSGPQRTRELRTQRKSIETSLLGVLLRLPVSRQKAHVLTGRHTTCPTPPISHRSALRSPPPAPAAHLCAPDIFSFPFTLSRTCFPGSHVAFPKWHLPLLPFPDHAN